jgi:1-acyl-sn-glycerol-3-phosphate acyltransferase
MRTALRALARLFFRDVEVAGARDVPADRGGLVVSWHPNGLVDPWLVTAFCPRPVVFGARHGLFRWPLLGFVLRRLGTVPLVRAADVSAASSARRQEANRNSLDALASRVAAGSFAALFPEGESHDEPHPIELRTGAARLYYEARRRLAPGSPPPAIVPVGLHYDKKQLFRARALVWFHPPLALPPALDLTPAPDEPTEAARQRARALTSEIERALHEAALATEDWQLHVLMHRARKLVRAERAARAGADPGRPGLEEKALGFARVRAGYLALRARDPARLARLKDRVESYDADLRALRLEDHHLDRSPRLLSPWLLAILVLQLVLVFLLMPPLLALGYVVNGPTALGVLALCRLAARRKKDEASIKVLVGLVAFPATWAAAGLLAARASQALHAAFPTFPGTPLGAGLLMAALGVLGGAVALRYLHVARLTWRAARVRFTRRRRRDAIVRLKRERSDLHDALVAATAGLDLPGEVAPDGTVRRPGATADAP